MKNIKILKKQNYHGNIYHVAFEIHGHEFECDYIHNDKYDVHGVANCNFYIDGVGKREGFDDFMRIAHMYYNLEVKSSYKNFVNSLIKLLHKASEC